MRIKRISSSVATMAVIVFLAVPVFAKPADEDGWTPSTIIKAVKRLVVKSFGDGITVPRP